MKAILAALLLSLAAVSPAAATEIIAGQAVQQVETLEACTQSDAVLSERPTAVDTISAVRAAFAAGADGVVLDFTTNGDGLPVVSYARQPNCSCAHPPCQQAGDAPSLRELLTVFPDGAFLLDMRGGLRGAADAMLAGLKAMAGMGLAGPGRVMVYSSHDDVMNQQAAMALPDMAVPGFVMQEAADCLTEYGERGVFSRPCYGAEIPLSIGQLRNMGSYAGEVLEAVHRAHGRLHILGVNNAEDYAFAAALEPDFIWTERIEALGL